MRTPETLRPKLEISIALMLTSALCEYTGFDLWLGGHFFSSREGWVFRDHWLTNKVVHQGGNYLTVTLAVFMLGCWIYSYFSSRGSQYRPALGALLWGGILSVLMVAGLKSITHIYSPWDLAMFGGAMPYIRIFDHVPMGIRVGHAFPAGHASGAYALIGIYRLAKTHHWKHPQYYLWGVLGLGVIFGLAQQMRGAHFVSHDLMTLAICWAISELAFCYAGRSAEPMGLAKAIDLNRGH